MRSVPWKTSDSLSLPSAFLSRFFSVCMAIREKERNASAIEFCTVHTRNQLIFFLSRARNVIHQIALSILMAHLCCSHILTESNEWTSQIDEPILLNSRDLFSRLIEFYQRNQRFWNCFSMMKCVACQCIKYILLHPCDTDSSGN